MLAARAETVGRQARFQPFFSRHHEPGRPGESVRVRLGDAQELWLVAHSLDRRRGAVAVAWGNPRLIASDGRIVPLAQLSPLEIRPRQQVLRRPQGKPNNLHIGGDSFQQGFTLVDGQVGYRLDKKYLWFEATVGADPLGPRAGAQFRVLAHPDLDLWQRLDRDCPTECDWFLGDLTACNVPWSANDWDFRQYPAKWFTSGADPDLQRRLLEKVLAELGTSAGPLRAEAERLNSSGSSITARWLDLYVRACQQRRAQRLSSLRGRCPRFVFTQHANLGGSHYAYTEAQSDAQAERHFLPGAALCLWEYQDGRPEVRTLLEDPHGMIRDPDVSADGLRVLFAWKKSDRLDDFHLYEMELATRKIRQLTFGLGLADYEGQYLPSGDIIFNSTRCVQTVDCFTTEVSNLYTCARDGRFLRRLGFDQVHSNYPTVTEDGRVLYTRWEYNDRGQIYPQALFQMNADGTGQTEFYGNNSWFPTTILHARNIFGTQKVLAIATGHHSRQTGKLIVLDPQRGRQENTGTQLVAPVRETPAVRVDAYGQDGELFQYPYPLSQQECLVSYAAAGWARAGGAWMDTGIEGRPPLFGIYWMTIDGRRELLAADPLRSCNQPVPLRPPRPRSRPPVVDYTKTQGHYYLQDIYAGPGLAGIPRGTVKKLRVVALDFRAAIIGGNNNGGPAGGAFISTPVAIGNGAWDPKIVLGEAEIQSDGSAFFSVPARTPVYFQAVDGNGHVVQTMRSWSTVQPGETNSCVGCHEDKNSTPVAYRSALALRRKPQQLAPFYGPARGFSFAKEIQPILDRHCTRCHSDRSQLEFVNAQAKPLWPRDTNRAAWDRCPTGCQLAAAEQRAGEATPPAGAARPTPPQSAAPNRPSPETTVALSDRSFSLLPEENVDPQAKRRWSDAYLVLTSAKPDQGRRAGALRGYPSEMVNWVSSQSAPPMQAPYSAGAATSRLMNLLAQGHRGVHLGREELDKIACWIDLAVPFCADYEEANTWSPDEQQRYRHFLAKRQRAQQIEDRNLADLLAQETAGRPAARPASEIQLTAELIDNTDKTVARRSGRARPDSPLSLEIPRPFQSGDRLRVSGVKQIAIEADRAIGPVPLYSPEGRFEIPIPTRGPKRGWPYPPAAFQADRPRLNVRPLCLRELDAYRNLAANPYDQESHSGTFPHATTNSVCRGEPVFAARNAIDNQTANRGHGGWPYQSWGPERQTDLRWKVDFGREVEIDKAVITLRADFPHDDYWHHATLVFSNGSRKTVALEKTHRPQTVLLGVTKTTSVELVDLREDEPPGWCALSEFEAWGRDGIEVAADLDAVTP